VRGPGREGGCKGEGFGERGGGEGAGGRKRGTDGEWGGAVAVSPTHKARCVHSSLPPSPSPVPSFAISPPRSSAHTLGPSVRPSLAHFSHLTSPRLLIQPCARGDGGDSGEGGVGGVGACDSRVGDLPPVLPPSLHLPPSSVPPSPSAPSVPLPFAPSFPPSQLPPLAPP
jgi:hypothetical protein